MDYRKRHLISSVGFALAIFLGIGKVSVRTQYRLDQWTTEDGLPQISVSSIIQTKDKYIWLATLDGLARFDGVRFKVFNKSNSPGITSNRFVGLYEDRNGDLWGVTELSGVVRRHNGIFQSFGPEHGLNTQRIGTISGDRERNVVLISADGNYIKRWNGKEFEPFSPQPGEVPTLELSRNIFCTRVAQVLRCLSGDSYVEPLSLEGYPNLYPFIPTAAARAADRSIWMIASDLRIVSFANDVGPAKVQKVGRGAVKIVTGRDLSLLFTGDDQSLRIYRPTTQDDLLLAGKSPESLSSPSEVLSAFEDEERNIWIGTARGGLFRARPQFITTFARDQGLAQENVYPIFQGRDGNIWIGTTKGLFKFENGIFTKVKGAPEGNVNAIGENGDGEVLFASNGIRTLDGNSAPFASEVATHLKATYAILHTPDGSLWIGGQGGLAAVKNGGISYLSKRDGLAGDEVKVIINDLDGGIWVGADEGFSHVKDGRVQSWTSHEGVRILAIRALYLDDERTVWIGSYDGGLWRLKDGRLTHYNTKIGLADDGAFQILEDARRNFWISSNRGIYRVRRDELNEFADGKRANITSVVYNKSDGMLINECNGGRWPAGIKTSDGRLWFPTQRGVSVIEPEKLIVNSKPPSVAIEDLRINNESISAEILQTSLSGANSSVEVPALKNSFEIEYTALSFISPENSQFKYKLEGLDSDWIQARTRRTASYSFLPPGSYTFHVIAANRDGVWNDKGARLRIRVLPAFYQTWWFSALLLLVLLGIVYLLFRARVSRVEEARLRQEEFTRKLLASQESERQRISSELHDSLGQTLLIIKNRITLAHADIGKRDLVEEQLVELSDSASSAIDEVREIAYNLRPFQISRFGLAKTLKGIFSRIGKVTPIEVIVDIDEVDHLLTDEAEISLFRIVQECSNNIIKHSNATEASLKISRGSDAVELKIRDNGHGFDRQERPGEAASYSGFGLVGIAERVRILNGKCSIESATGRGTSVTITLKNFRTNGRQQDDHSG